MCLFDNLSLSLSANDVEEIYDVIRVRDVLSMENPNLLPLFEFMLHERCLIPEQITSLYKTAKRYGLREYSKLLSKYYRTVTCDPQHEDVDEYSVVEEMYNRRF